MDEIKLMKKPVFINLSFATFDLALFYKYI